MKCYFLQTPTGKQGRKSENKGEKVTESRREESEGGHDRNCRRGQERSLLSNPDATPHPSHPHQKDKKREGGEEKERWERDRKLLEGVGRSQQTICVSSIVSVTCICAEYQFGKLKLLFRVKELHQGCPNWTQNHSFPPITAPPVLHELFFPSPGFRSYFPCFQFKNKDVSKNSKVPVWRKIWLGRKKTNLLIRRFISFLIPIS